VGTSGSCGEVDGALYVLKHCLSFHYVETQIGLEPINFRSLGFIGGSLDLEELQRVDSYIEKKSIGRKHRRVVKSQGGVVSLVVGKDLQVI